MKVSDMIIQKLEDLFGRISHLAQAVSDGCLQYMSLTSQVNVTDKVFIARACCFQLQHFKI